MSAVRPAEAYPTSVVFAPSAETLDFGAFLTFFALNFRHNPQPVDVASLWGGLNVGVLPSVKLGDSPAGAIEIGGVEAGFDVGGPADDGRAALVFNFKAQLLRETLYLPAIAAGVFQVAADSRQGAALGYFALTKQLLIREVNLGQLTFGMMTSFANGGFVAPQCQISGAPYCLFRGSAPFEDRNAAFLAGYQSPAFGPMILAIDHVGGTSSVSSTNIMLGATLVPDILFTGAGVYFANDRRDVPEGPTIVDGFFLVVAFGHSLPRLFSQENGTKEPSRR